MPQFSLQLGEFLCISAPTLDIHGISPKHPLGCPHLLLQLPQPVCGLETFYTRALDYLDALDIETDEADNCHKGWKHLKLMLEGDDRRLSSPS